MVDAIEERRKQVTVELESLSRQVDEMDGKIRAYLADRQNKPHPRHLEFIDKIQNYRLPSEIFTKHLATLLDNLQWKVHYSKQAWKQLWDNADSILRREGSPVAASAGEMENPQQTAEQDAVSARGQYSVETLWEIQQEKLRVYNAGESTETKLDFKKRMIQEYKELARRKAPGQEIVMVYDQALKQCRLDVK